MDITGFLNQTAVYERYSHTNAWGDAVYERPITIPVRKSRKAKLHRFENQVTRINVGQIPTNAVDVQLQDRIDNEELLAVEDYVDIDGTVIGYTAFPRPPIGYSN